MTENQLNEMFRLLTICVTTTQEIKVSVANLETRMTKVEARLENVENRLGNLENRVAGLQNEFHDFRNETNQNFEKIYKSLDSQSRKINHLTRDNLDLNVRVEKLEEKELA
ncbi:MAG: hypothetical protein H7Z37_00050 [Pyrinomonadaceae bacterium]|nr:hypothetical protein [Pyrinomonadaceae bacterium]